MVLVDLESRNQVVKILKLGGFNICVDRWGSLFETSEEQKTYII
jgi:hypothetical protein